MKRYAVALHDWAGAPSTEEKRYLIFSAGARIEIIEEREAGGWWAGRLDGKLGWFPSSFCTIEEVTPSVEPPLAAVAPRQPSIPHTHTASAASSQARQQQQPPQQPQPQQQQRAVQQPGVLIGEPLASSDARAKAFYADFELPLTSAAVSPARRPAAASVSAGVVGVAGGPASPQREFAGSVGEFAGGAHVGVSGPTPLDRRLQTCELTPKLLVAPMPARGSGGGGSGGTATAARARAHSRPIWQSLTFIDMFADAAGGARAALGSGSAVPRGLTALGASMSIARRVLLTLSKQAAAAAAAATVSSTDEFRQFAPSGPFPELDAAAEGLRSGMELLGLANVSGGHGALLAYLEQVVLMVAAVGVGSALAVPMAWDTDESAFVLVLHRTDEGAFSVALCNWGPGIERHPARLHAATGGVQRTPAMDMRGVARERLIDTGFW